MSLERKRQMMQLLDEALEQAPGERATFLANACDDTKLRQEVASLLDTDVTNGVLAKPAFDIHAEDAALGRTIDKYKLVRMLSRGGMGTVYLAEREDYEHRVALKLIRRGLDIDDVFVRRFHNERQILARLQHPYIAHLLDGGTTEDGVPYFVMEYVEGEPLDQYCARNGLSVKERLELFRDVCSAVQFAHQNLVIHRDLKPGNILIDAQGRPKLLDFGIAKLLDDSLAAQTVATAPEGGAMTPRYASPEQIRLEPLTTASDVYTLGVLLYELLTGLDPYQSANKRRDEVARAICDEEPDKPSTAVRRRVAERDSESVPESQRLRRRLSGDLDSIVLKAMRKEPSERYNSPERLADDIHRHLEGLPVKAQPASFVYLAGKFVRRYKVAAAFLFLLLAFSVVSTILWQRAQEDRRVADASYEIMRDIVGAVNRNKTREQVAQTLYAGSIDVSQKLGKHPERLIEVAGSLGVAFRSLWSYEESREFMELALRTSRKHFGKDASETFAPRSNLVVLLFDYGKFVDAENMFRGILKDKAQLGQSGQKLFRIKGNLASALMMQGKLTEAEAIYREVLNDREALYENELDADTAQSRKSLAALLFVRGDFAQAQEETQKALHVFRHHESARRIASTVDLLGRVEEGLGNRDRAKRMILEGLEIRQRLYDEDHPRVAKSKMSLAALLAAANPDEAHSLIQEVLAVFERDKPQSWETAEAESILGGTLTRLQRYDEARSLLATSYEKLVKIRGAENTTSRRALERIRYFNQLHDPGEQIEFGHLHPG